MYVDVNLTGTHHYGWTVLLNGIQFMDLFHIHILFVNFTAEVLEAKRNSDREQLNKLKEQLLISFKDQMELR